MTIYRIFELHYTSDRYEKDIYYRNKKDAEDYMFNRAKELMSKDYGLFILDKYVDWSKCVRLYSGSSSVVEPEIVISIREIEVR